MAKWSMVIDLDKCVACQGCSIACRFENNTPVVSPEEAALGRSILWNEVFPLRSEGEAAIASAQAKFLTRPCMHCEDPPCIKVCPVGATYKDDEGIVRQNYARCIGCRFCTVACPYGVRYFNWYEPSWEEGMDTHLNPDRVAGRGDLEGPAIRPKGVVEKCTFCIHRHHKAIARAEAEGREFRNSDYTPACVQTCTAKARFFGDFDDPNSTVSRLSQSRRAFRLLDEAGTSPKVIYLHEG
ncbi:MAG: 4Fe-4S dicluster domain-containing protein [Chloroflexi bacterium]|nr:4Fe-4S dicluster domain-containing protein [Chloroflexota bacterium]